MHTVCHILYLVKYVPFYINHNIINIQPNNTFAQHNIFTIIYIHAMKTHIYIIISFIILSIKCCGEFV